MRQSVSRSWRPRRARCTHNSTREKDPLSPRWVMLDFLPVPGSATLRAFMALIDRNKRSSTPRLQLLLCLLSASLMSWQNLHNRHEVVASTSGESVGTCERRRVSACVVRVEGARRTASIR